jgi:hypothetical protein
MLNISISLQYDGDNGNEHQDQEDESQPGQTTADGSIIEQQIEVI